jgi:hypothetical protein
MSAERVLGTVLNRSESSGRCGPACPSPKHLTYGNGLLHCEMSTRLMSPQGLGRVITRLIGLAALRGQFGLPQPASATISGLAPTMFMTRVRL